MGLEDFVPFFVRCPLDCWLFNRTIFTQWGEIKAVVRDSQQFRFS